ncbi:MAG TPA: ABC transporter permease subunit [Acholeplasmataceae bacterium]|nr:ABC transporter permease subunit [Acholeplasmataceae bacterium]
MNNNQNFWSKIWSSIKDLFVRLFGIGKSKDRATSVLEEEEIVSPSKQIFRNFIRNKVAIIGLTIFVAIVLFVVIGRAVIDFDHRYTESSQIYIEPGTDHLKIPKGLKKSGIKVVKDFEGNDQYLMGVGNAFTIAISNDNKIYVWGANEEKIKKVPKEIQENADKIVQLAVGADHAVVLTSDGKLLAWGSNGQQQAQIPTFNMDTDDFYGLYKKSIEAYFKPEVRYLYPDDLITTIEEDPIKKVVAGYQYTSILTESGIIYSWGNTKEVRISEERYSYRFTEIEIKYDGEKLTWKYIGPNITFNIATNEEIIDYYNLPTEEDREIELTYSKNALSWRYDDEEEWTTLATKEDILEYIKPNIKKVTNIYALESHMVYEFEDNSIFIMGQAGSIMSQLTEDLRVELFKSAEERGYRVEKVVGTERNAFVLTSEGNIFGWGESTTEALPLITIPDEVKNSKIVDLVSGKYHLVARDDKGNVYTWGSKNSLNQLDIPKKLAKSEKIISNYFINYSIGEDGSIQAWGHKGYIFGTDLAGADVFKRIIAGGAMSLSLALVAVVVSLIIGLIIGLVAGFYGKWVDNLLMRFGEIISAFPFLPLAMTLAKIVQEAEIDETYRVYMIMVVLGLLSWPGLARLVRGQILKEREQDFVLAAKALGIKEKHIITRHILPNVINVVIVSTTLSYAGALLTESGLSFLGFGVRYPKPSWGNMLTGTQSMTVLRYYWWAWIIPAIFIILTALSVNLVGDGLREAMDPKANER